MAEVEHPRLAMQACVRGQTAHRANGFWSSIISWFVRARNVKRDLFVENALGQDPDFLMSAQEDENKQAKPCTTHRPHSSSVLGLPYRNLKHEPPKRNCYGAYG